MYSLINDVAWTTANLKLYFNVLFGTLIPVSLKNIYPIKNITENIIAIIIDVIEPLKSCSTVPLLIS